MLSPSISQALSTNKCQDYVAPNGEEIIVEAEDSMNYISLPSELEEEGLKNLILWIFRDFEGNTEELAVPLFFNVEDGVAKSFFHASEIYGEFQIQAIYGDKNCGPRLIYKFAI